MSSEVGSGHVAIFPTMVGFKARVAKEVKSAGTASARDFAASMKGAGAANGARLGRDMKSALTSATRDMGTASLGSLNRDVAAAAAALSKARLKQLDEAGKVRVAEARLAEQVQKHGATSSQAIAAEERLASARRAHAAATDTVTAATTRLKGAQEAVRTATSAAARTTTSAWSRLGQSAASGLRSLVSGAATIGRQAGEALAAAMKGTATAGVTAIAAGLSVALGSGFARLSNLDTARAKLTGLGHDGTVVAEVMRNATASVRGTAFGLGEAANVAAGAMAAQIKPGEALQTHLKRVANNAAAAGTSMEEMGSIFNKAATQANGVQNDVISQLADKGIPIYQELGKILGVTAGEVFKLASEGKVDFETFSRAAEAAAGTVADEIGKTVPGAFKNLRASLGRIGANLFGGIGDDGEMFGLYAKLGPLLASITKAFGPVEQGAKGLGATLDNVIGKPIERVTAFLNRLGEGGDSVKEKLSGLMPVLAPVGAAFLALGSGGLAGLLTRIPMLGGMLGGLTGPLAMLGGPLGIAAAAIAAFTLSGADAEGLVTGLTGIIDRVVAALPSLIEQVVAVVPKLVQGILAAIPQLLTAATGIVTALVNGIVTALPMIVEGGVQLVDGLIAAIISALPTIIQGAIALVTALIDGIVTALPLIIQGALTLVSALLSGIVSALPSIIEGGVQVLMALVNGLIAALPMLLEAALGLLMGLVGALIENLPLIIAAGIELLMALVNGLIEALPELITAAINLVLQLVVGLLTMLPELIKAGVELVVALIVGLVQAIPQIIAMLPQIISAIWDGLMGVDWLDLGVQIVMGIIKGLGSMVGALVDAIVKLAGAAFDGFKSFFGIASPAKKMIQPGRDVVRGATKGVEQQAPSYGDSLVAMAEDAASRAQRAMSSAVVSASVGVNRDEVAPSSARDGAAGSGSTVRIAKEDLDYMVQGLGALLRVVVRQG